jgi:hypothetical protein
VIGGLGLELGLGLLGAFVDEHSRRPPGVDHGPLRRVDGHHAVIDERLDGPAHLVIAHPDGAANGPNGAAAVDCRHQPPAFPAEGDLVLIEVAHDPRVQIEGRNDRLYLLPFLQPLAGLPEHNVDLETDRILSGGRRIGQKLERASFGFEELEADFFHAASGIGGAGGDVVSHICAYQKAFLQIEVGADGPAADV